VLLEGQAHARWGQSENARSGAELASAAAPEATVVSTVDAPPGIFLGKLTRRQRSPRPTGSKTDPTGARPRRSVLNVVRRSVLSACLIVSPERELLHRPAAAPSARKLAAAQEHLQSPLSGELTPGGWCVSGASQRRRSAAPPATAKAPYVGGSRPRGVDPPWRLTHRKFESVLNRGARRPS